MKHLRILFALLFIAATPHPLGWKSAPRHSKGLRQMATHPTYKAAPLPAAASVKHLMRKPYDQLNIGSCVANAGAAAFDANWKARTGKFIDPSRLDLYQSCLLFDGNPGQDMGTYTSTALKVLITRGVLLERKWPYKPENLQSRPTPAGRQRATYAAVKAYDVSNTDGGYSVKQAIANAKLPVMVGGYVYNDIFSVNDREPFVPMPRGNPIGGHEVLIVSYDDNMVHRGYKGFAEIMNSWGENWGRGGFAWVPYAYIFNPRQFEDFGVIEVTGPRIKQSAPVSSPERIRSKPKTSKQRSGFIESKKVFIGPTALLEEIEGQMRWRLMRDVVYRTPKGDIITAKQGLITDLASIPRWAWTILPPWHPHYGRAALIHDQLYRNRGQMDDRRYTRKESDEVFRYAMKDLGASAWKRCSMFTAVRIGNPEWN